MDSKRCSSSSTLVKMADARITLAYGNTIQTIELFPSSVDRSIVDTIKNNAYRVYQDQIYRIKLDVTGMSYFSTLFLKINDERVKLMRSSDGGWELLPDEYERYIFSQCYGYVQFQLTITRNGIVYNYESPFISVMVKKGSHNDSVKRMTEYIYHNDAVLLADRSNTTKVDLINNVDVDKTIETKLVLLNRIISMLERNYPYFKINSRYKTVHVERKDYFDKLQFVSSSTIQYIAQHPDELRRSTANTGIVIGGHRYQPERTLITQNAISYDIEENRAILGFIEKLSYDVMQLQKEIKKLIEDNEYEIYEENDYISSAYYIYISTIDILRSMEEKATGYVKRILAIQLAYSQVFGMKAPRMISMPKPTAVFMSVPQYKQLYDCMNEWLKNADVGLQIHNKILGLKKISEIYEFYALLKMCSYFVGIGYTLLSAERIEYRFTGRVLYRNTLNNNKFVFVNGDDTVTLYYQPVLYSDTGADDYGLGLYRNNTLRIQRDEDEYYEGHYYTPDYVIKYENPNYSGRRYFLLDAKYMTLEKVKRTQIPELTFKYLFSTSPVNIKDSIVGLYVLNGRSDDSEDRLTNVYNRSRNEGLIMPRAEIITLTENSTDNAEMHERLLTSSFGRFIG